MKHLDFATSLNVLGPPPELARLLAERAIAELRRPSDPMALAARSALARYFRAPVECVAPCVGAAEALRAAPEAAAAHRVIAISPYAAPVAEAVRRSHLPFQEIKTTWSDGFAVDLDELARTADDGDVVLFGNPTSPAGVLSDRKALLDLVDRRPGVTFVVEETALFLRADAEERSLLWDAPTRKNLVVVQSLSTQLGLPGLRLGFLVAAPETVERFRDVLVPNGIGRLGELVLEGLELARPFLLQSREYFPGEQQRLSARIAAEAAGLVDVLPSGAHWSLLKLRGSKTAGELCARMERRGFVLRDASAIAGLGPSFVRLTLRTPADDDALVMHLAHVAEEMKRSSDTRLSPGLVPLAVAG